MQKSVQNKDDWLAFIWHTILEYKRLSSTQGVLTYSACVLVFSGSVIGAFFSLGYGLAAEHPADPVNSQTQTLVSPSEAELFTKSGASDIRTTYGSIPYTVTAEEDSMGHALVLDCVVGQAHDRAALFLLADAIYKQRNGDDYEQVLIHWHLGQNDDEGFLWAVSDMTREDTVLRFMNP